MLLLVKIAVSINSSLLNIKFFLGSSIAANYFARLQKPKIKTSKPNAK